MKILNEIQQKLKAPKSNRNNFGNYNYRSCEDILEAVKPLLRDAILTMTDDIVAVENRIYVKATVKITHEAETWSATAFAREADEMKGMTPSQLTGTASSYARKYALNALFAIDDTKDDDTRDNTIGIKTEVKKEIKKEIKKITFDELLDRIENIENIEQIEKAKVFIDKQKHLNNEEIQELLNALNFKAGEVLLQ